MSFSFGPFDETIIVAVLFRNDLIRIFGALKPSRLV
jgi:hypothetical protein